MSVEDKKQTGRKRRAVKQMLWVINMIFIFLLLLSYLASYISPQYVWWMELFALAYGVLLSVNLFFIALWLILRKRYFLYSLLAVLIGLSRVFGIFQFGFGDHSVANPDHSSTHPQLKVMTYNVHLFDLYNWFNNYHVRSKMFRFLARESPDIVCFQEFYSSTRTDYPFENADTLKKILSAPHTQIEYTLTLHGGDNFGIATYSKFPIINKQTVHFAGTDNIFIYSDVVAGADTFRVLNVHLESDRFQPADYRFIKDFDIGKHKDNKAEAFFKRVVSIISRLKASAIRRGQQAAVMKQYISESPYPVIVCGDFNDTPSSYTAHVLRAGLKDAFRESGYGFGKTYLGAFPSFRIDYILHDEKIESTGFTTIMEKFSDHYPLSCILQRK